jgi:HK97 family phage prohead protease
MTLLRAFQTDFEVRADGRTIFGLAVPYNEAADIRERNGTRFMETFRRGAFSRTITERASKVKLLLNHNRQALPVGRAETLREDPQGLYAEFRVSKTEAGDEALTLAADGTLDAFSIGFEPVRDQWSKDRRSVERLEAKLMEVSLVAFPAYQGALVGGVRADAPFLSQEAARARLRLLTKELTK